MLNISQIFPQNWQKFFDPKYKRIGVGYDVATTTNKLSNPNSIVLCQPCGDIYYMRLALVFKTGKPQVIYEIFKHIVENLPHGLKLGKVCVDATSERWFAKILKQSLQDLDVPCELVDSSSSTEYLGEKMNFKCFLGNQLCADFEEGRIAIPNEEFAKVHIRQVYRTKGTFAADVDTTGNHADFFDAMKLARYAVSSAEFSAEAQAISFGSMLMSEQPKRISSDKRFNKSLAERLFT
ncbi:MAG: hypothetical protein E7035_01485 [Verrucomicrobiaceae bacterium]|nr:hypothetical protein [Verrucomicrobiaceae bacterium]